MTRPIEAVFTVGVAVKGGRLRAYGREHDDCRCCVHEIGAADIRAAKTKAMAEHRSRCERGKE